MAKMYLLKISLALVQKPALPKESRDADAVLLFHVSSLLSVFLLLYFLWFSPSSKGDLTEAFLREYLRIGN